jgi:hypothetical protein
MDQRVTLASSMPSPEFSRDGSRAQRTRLPRAFVVMVLLLLGCASLDMPRPSLDGPQISDLRFKPPVGVAGCPMSVKVHVDGATAALVLIRTGWRQSYGRSASHGEFTLPLEPDEASDAGGDLTIPFVPERPGRYQYRLQVEDQRGRRSNVLTEQFRVPLRWNAPSSCPPPGDAEGHV